MRYAMQLRDIEYMVTIADKQSFSQAAEALFISQPALSQSIKRLEEEIGVALFARKRKKVLLTRAGELFLQADEDQQVYEIAEDGSIDEVEAQYAHGYTIGKDGEKISGYVIRTRDLGRYVVVG